MIPGLHPALRRVLWVRVRAIAREAGRKLATPGGVLVALLLVGLLASPVAMRLLMPSMGDPETLSRWGTTGVLALWLVQVLLRGGSDVLGFEPAEADQLFAAPVPHEQLMRYKLGLLVIAWTNGGVLLAPVVWMYSASLLGAFLAALLVMPFLQLSAMVMALLRRGAGMPPAVRLLALAALVFMPAALAGGVGAGAGAVAEGVNATAASPIGMVLLAPFVAAATLLSSPDPGVVLASAVVVLAFDAVLAGLLLRLGQRAWLETAQSGADVIRSRLQAVRSGGLAGASGWMAVPVPRLPRLGGFGPILWRRTVELVRRPATWGGFGGVLALVVALGLVVGTGRRAADGLLVAGLMWSTVMLPSVLRSDFRADLDRMDALRAMPVGVAWLYLGNVLPMGILIGAFESALAVGLFLVQPEIVYEAAAAAVLAPLWSVLVVTAENTVFLYVPARMEAGEAAIGSVGRNLLSTMLGWTTHGVITAVAVGAGGAGMALGGPLVGLGVTAGVLVGGIGVLAGVGMWKLARFVPPVT